MNAKMVFGSIIIVVLLLVMTVLVLPSIIDFGDNVIIEGTVYYDMVNGWGVTFDGYRIEDANLLDYVMSLSWYWPWETKDVKIEVVMGTHERSTIIGTMGNILDQKEFTVKLHSVESGHYYGTIYLYEGNTIIFGFGESNMVLKAQANFEVTV